MNLQILPPGNSLVPPQDAPAEDPLDLMEEIDALKKQKDVTILAHFYVDGDIQDIADFTGDSLKLARDATRVSTSAILFAGVHFMGESAKIMNPQKKVLIPRPPRRLLTRRQLPARTTRRLPAATPRTRPKFPYRRLHQHLGCRQKPRRLDRHQRKCPRNHRSRPARQKLLFVPDQHLGRYLMEVTGRRMILWPGGLHGPRSLQHPGPHPHPQTKPRLPRHGTPRMPQNILEISDVIGGTEKMRQFVMQRQQPTTFLVATEATMIHPLQKAAPQHTFIPVPGIMTSSGETCAAIAAPTWHAIHCRKSAIA
jgi:quinolinate synthase